MMRKIYYYLRKNDLNTSDENRFVANIKKVTKRRILFNLPKDLAAGDYWFSVMPGNDPKAPRGIFESLVTIT